MSSAMESAAALEIRKRRVEACPWVSMLLAAVCFFLIEHTLQASLIFQEIMGLTTAEEFSGFEDMFSGSFSRQLAGFILGMVGVLQILQRGWARSRPMNFLSYLIVLYSAWILFSLVWSTDPNQSFRRLIMFFCLALAALAFSGRFSLRHVLGLALLAPGGYLVIGVLAEIGNGTFTPFTSGYRFCGTLHPNLQAINCAIFFLAAWCWWRWNERRRARQLLVAALALYFLYLTKSRTALSSVAAAVFLFDVLAMPLSRRVMVVFLALSGVAIFFLFDAVSVPLVQQSAKMGREDLPDDFGKLTGRRALWEQCREFIDARPVFGFGYGAFWSRQNSEIIMDKQGWPISHAHNAYLDAWLEAGPFAVFLFALLLLVGTVKSILAYRRAPQGGLAFASMLLLFIVGNSMLESAAVQRTMLTFFLMLILSMLAFQQADAPPEPGEPEQESTA